MKEIGEYKMSDRVTYKEVVNLINTGNKTINNNLIELNRKMDRFMAENDHSHQLIFEKINEVHIQATKTNGRANRLEDITNRQEMDLINTNKKVTLNTNSRIKRTAQIAVISAIAGVIGFVVSLVLSLIK